MHVYNNIGMRSFIIRLKVRCRTQVSSAKPLTEIKHIIVVCQIVQVEIKNYSELVDIVKMMQFGRRCVKQMQF